MYTDRDITNLVARVQQIGAASGDAIRRNNKYPYAIITS